MNFEDAKKEILNMADAIKSNQFTEQSLTDFVLSFRYDLFQQRQTFKQLENSFQNIRHGISCSCAPELKSCDECGEGNYTKFVFGDQGNILGSVKVKK